jgi:hypothetical protein
MKLPVVPAPTIAKFLYPDILVRRMRGEMLEPTHFYLSLFHPSSLIIHSWIALIIRRDVSVTNGADE